MIDTLSELKRDSAFQIDGIIALDGLPFRQEFPFTKNKIRITEHHFMFVIKDPELNHFSMHFYFYPIQKFCFNQEYILTIYNENCYIQISLDNTGFNVKIGDVYKYFSLNDLNFLNWNSFSLNVNLQKDADNCFVSINNKKLSFQIKKELFLNFITNKEFYAKLGNKDEKNSFKGLISSFFLINKEINEDLFIYFEKKIFNNPSLELFNETIIQPFKSIADIQNFNKKDKLNISTVPMRKINRNQKKTKVIACHDMMGGYKEDAWTYGYPSSSFSYRFHHLNHIDYFIYFSHHLLTIPPPSWTNICHSFGVMSLGVLITEGNDGTYLNDQILNGTNNNEFFYADLLIDICKHYKFDGYLMNFEARVSNINQLIKWLSYLKNKIHEVVAGSVIIWYDSVITDGNIRWQSQLNHLNRVFYEASDLFFSDYHWNLNKFQSSLSNAGNEKLKIFQGIDIWGRGSYEGGQFNTWKGCKVCFESQCSVALFAQAWTYENADGSREKFILSDNKLWFGEDYQTLFDNSKDKWINEVNGGNGWQVYYDDELKSEVAIASFEICLRSFSCDLLNRGLNLVEDPITVVFSFMVKGTPPKVEDLWFAVIELYDRQNKFLCSFDSKTRNISYSILDYAHSMEKATDKWQNITLELEIKKLDINVRNNLRFIKFIEMGKDIEYWAGNYGSRYCKESIIIKQYDPKKDLTKYLKPKRIYELPIHTYFNEGQGEFLYIDGIKANKPETFYNNINDFDYCFDYRTKIIKSFGVLTNLQPFFNIKICNDLAWNGGSCINLSGNLTTNQRTIIKLFKVSYECKSDNEFSCDLNIQDLNQNLKLEIYLILSNKNVAKMDFFKESNINGWNSIKFWKKIEENNILVKGIYLSIFNPSDSMIDFSFKIGGFSFYDNLYKKKIENINLKSVSNFEHNIISKQGFKNFIEKNLNSKYLDIAINLNLPVEILNEIKYFRVFKNNNEWILNSRNNYIILENIEFDQKSEYGIKIQLLLKNGFHMKVENIEPLFINKNSIISLTQILE